MMSSDISHWYTSWFNTPYYHILYKDRDHREARLFMDNLTSHLLLNSDAHILDLACGKGRHSVYLNELGFEVTGVDLSEESIAYARQFENERLHFDIHDMCEPYHRKFDAVFNLFTSFGYFEKPEDNLKTIKAIKANLKDGGLGVIDFMNVNYVLPRLVKENNKQVEGIHFKMTRDYENGYIVKKIRFSDEGRDYEFSERVRAFTLNDFMEMFLAAGVELKEVYGDYQLNEYNESNSSRLIMIFE